MQRWAAHTASGREIWYLHPERTEVVESDLRTALSRQCRYAGAIEWSVLRHSALVAMLAAHRWSDKLTTAYAAAHDFHEAYLPDLPSPLVDLLGLVEDPAAVLDLRIRGEVDSGFTSWRAVADRWDAHVHPAVGLRWPRPPEIDERIRAADRRALVVESVLGGGSARIREALEQDCGGAAGRDELRLGRICAATAQAGLWRIVWRHIEAGRAA